MSSRFVILRHEGIADPHFDLMLEISGIEGLETYRCPAWPPSLGQTLTKIGLHRRVYLDYEGPVFSGGGTVRRITAGNCEVAVAHSFPPEELLRFPDFQMTIRNSMGRDRKASDLWEVVELQPT
jgi:hypothetical protein